METKTCLDCAEKVQSAAKVCRFCGYDFARRRNSNFTKGDAAGCALTGCMVWIFWPVAVIALLVAIGSMLPSSQNTMPAATSFSVSEQAQDESENAAAMGQVQPGQVNQSALNAMFPAEKKRNAH